MDWRERKYYLVRFNDSTLSWWNKKHDDCGVGYSDYCSTIKHTVPTVKFGKPYNHFKHNDIKKDNYDGEIIEIGYVQLLMSCRKENCHILENILNDISCKDKYCIFKEITKDMCEQ